MTLRPVSDRGDDKVASPESRRALKPRRDRVAYVRPDGAEMIEVRPGEYVARQAHERLDSDDE